MKKNVILLFALSLTALASCGGTSSPSSSVAPSSSASGLSISSTEPSESDANWVDYAHNGSVKLALDYKGHTFAKDGIEQVTLWQAIDGDTAHFTPLVDEGGELIKSRFYGIDTPESTGKVQEYGKEASYYTAGVLEKANKSGTIVVSSAQTTYGLPQPDSTGSRYLSLIWVNLEKKNAPMDELYLLNLMIVQEGYSWVKNLSEMPEYSDAFLAAEQQAKTYKLNLHSGKPAPLFNYGDYEDASLLDIKKEVVAQLKDPTHKNAFDNKKVRVQGTVAGFANHIIYIQDFYPTLDEQGNEQTDGEGNIIGEYAGINIFCGMGSVYSKFTTPNAYIQVCGLALDSEFGFQVTDVTLPAVSYSENDGKVLIPAAKNTDEHALHTFEYTKDEFNAQVASKEYESLYCAVSVTTPLKVERAFYTNKAMYLYFQGADFDAYYTFNYQPQAGTTWNTAEQMTGKTFLVSGVLATHTTTKGELRLQIYPRSSADLVYIEEN